jgi:precorrin-2 dehydrogenase/sirohydrochlorin ferrochelatase
MAKYPIYLELGGKRVVVIGAGSVASRKVAVLCQAGAKVLVVAKEIQAEFSDRCKDLDIEIIEGEYSKEYLAGAVMVMAATNVSKLNTRIYKDCNELNVICNVVDVPELCDFYVPAKIERGPLQIAIGTNGASPAYSAKLRRQLEDLFTETHGQFAAEMGVVRKKVIEHIADGDVRKKIFEALVTDESFDCFVNDGAEAWRKYAEKLVAGNSG